MTTPSRYYKTITVLRPGPRDRWGGITPGTSFIIERCFEVPAASRIGNRSTGSTEVLNDADTTLIHRALYAPPDSPLIFNDDQVEFDGQVWEVDGDPAQWVNKNTWRRSPYLIELVRQKG